MKENGAQPLLTIAIPTFNRVNKLNQCIQHIMKQVADNDAVEILVSDNASEDNTFDCMTELCDKYSKIKYYRNEKNEGPDKNFLKCYERAKGKYVLLLGDDDFLMPGAVDSIIISLMKDPVVVFLNSSGMKGEEPLVPGRPRMKEQGDLIFSNRNEALENVGVYITFVSSLVLKSELIRKIENKELYIGTYFLQSHIALRTMAEDGLYVINTKNCLAASGNETVSYDLYYVWFEAYHKLFTTTAMESGFNEQVLKKIYLDSLKSTIEKFVIRFRMTCSNESVWNKEYVYNNIEKDQNVGKEISFLIRCPRKWLKIYWILWKLREKGRKTFRG